MTKHYKTVEIPAKTEQWFDHVVCDICGKSSHNRDDWDSGSYTHDEITIKRETRTSYPEGGWNETTEYDICPECWETKLEPFLQSLGAQPTKRELDW